MRPPQRARHPPLRYQYPENQLSLSQQSETPPIIVESENNSQTMAASNIQQEGHFEKFQGTLPDLEENGSNFHLWNMALTDLADINDLSHLLSSTCVTPSEATPQYKAFRKKRAFLRMQMISSLPKSFEFQLTLTPETSPFELLQAIKSKFTSSTPTDHHILRYEAESALFKDDMTVEDFVKMHQEIRNKMRNSHYPQIQEEAITIDFMVKALEANHKFKHLPDSWIENANIPTSIQDFEQRLKAIQARQQSKNTPLAPSTPPTGIQSPPQQEGSRPRYRGRGRGRGRGRYPQNVWHQQPPPFPPNFYPYPPPINYPSYRPMAYPNQPLIPYPYNPPIPHGPQRRPNRRTKPEANTTHTDIQEKEDDALLALEAQISQTDTGTFALDSGAHPTHVKKPSANMKQLHSPLRTHSATNNATFATHYGPTQITTNQNITFDVPAVSNPDIQRNLLSVHQLAKEWGHVIFSPKQAYILNTIKSRAPRLIGTASFVQGLYLLDRPLNAPSQPTCFSTRTFPAKPSSNTKRGIAPPPKASSKPTTSRDSGRYSPALPAPRRQITPTSIHQLYNPGNPPSPRSTLTATQEYSNQHLIFNHTRPQTLHQMAKLQMHPAIPPVLQNSPPKLTCSGCATGKTKPKPHPRVIHRYHISVSMSSDVCGPITPASRNGNRYFITFLDTKSRYLIVDFLQNRKNISTRIRHVLQAIKATTGKTPHLFRTDNAKEYISRDTTAVYVSFNINHSTSMPYTPQQNSLAERVNSTLVSTARATLCHSGLPPTYWEDAIRDATHKYNLIMHTSTGLPPYTLWFGKKPTNTNLYIFGQLGTVPHLAGHTEKPKLQSRSDPVRYLYPIDDNLITVLNLRNQRPQRSRACDFSPYYRQTDPVATSTAAFKAFTPHSVPAVILTTSPSPLSHKQATKYPDAEMWAVAHNAELDNLDKNKVIDWIPANKMPFGTKPIPLTMTYRYKRDNEGNITRRKARCALRGDKMLPHVHYDPDRITTYMSDKATVRLLFAIAATYSLHLEHWDIEAAFLHEKCKHDPPVYVTQFPRFDGSLKHPSRIGKLVGNLYGDKEAGYIYLQGAAKYLLSLNFKQSQAEPCLFYRLFKGSVTFVNVNTDDFNVASSSVTDLNEFYQDLSKKYKVKRLGFPSQYLGWKVRRTSNGGIHISQPAAIEAILQKTRLQTANGKPTPYIDNAHLYPTTASDKPAPLPVKQYQKILGELRYIADSTRPDIYFVTNRLAVSATKPSTRHWSALKRVLRYLRSTTTHGIYYPSRSSTDDMLCRSSLNSFVTSDKRRSRQEHNLLVSYSDADHAANPVTRKSISGMVHTYNNAPIAWASVSQTIHALSTCEAEYVAATSAVQQTTWLRRVLADLHMLLDQPTTFFLDNQSAIQVAKSTGPTKRRKVIDLRHHYLQGHIKKGNIRVLHIPSANMLADIFTKALKPKPFLHLRQHLNLVSPSDNSCSTRDRRECDDTHSKKNVACRSSSSPP